MDLFFIKKVVGTLISPLNMGLFGLLISLALFHVNAKASFILLAVSILFLLVFSIPYTANAFIKNIEGNKKLIDKPTPDVKYIAVLGSYYSENDELPPLGQLSPYGLQRVTEGVRLWYLNPHATLIFSGGSIGTKHSYAHIASLAAQSLGVPKDSILIEEDAIDTQQEAYFIKKLIKDDLTFLVTNANHMPRAKVYFEKAGVNFIPAKTGFWSKQNGSSSLGYYQLTPNDKKLTQSAAGLYELMGKLWQKVK